jgi:NADPH2:quinone reductase
MYTGINFIDIYFRTGLYPTPNLPFIPGRETSGVIESVGSGVNDLKKGDLVVSLHDKAYAEYSVAEAFLTTKIPEGIKPDVAVAALLQGLTALTLTEDAHPVKKVWQFTLRNMGLRRVNGFLCMLVLAVWDCCCSS